jgi:acyl carrier protein
MRATLTREAIAETVIDIIVKQESVPREIVKPGATFIGDIGMDSLGVTEMLMTFEETFDLNIPDDAVENIRTVGEAVDYLESRL